VPKFSDKIPYAKYRARRGMRTLLVKKKKITRDTSVAKTERRLSRYCSIAYPGVRDKFPCCESPLRKTLGRSALSRELRYEDTVNAAEMPLACRHRRKLLQAVERIRCARQLCDESFRSGDIIPRKIKQLLLRSCCVHVTHIS
jgi:hypothetical protein